MMTELLTPPSSIFFTSDGFGIEPKVYTKKGGAKIYSGVAVFRSGTFRDSTGEQNTWEDLHVKQMVDNYDYLTGKNILMSVPARDGHKSWLVSDIPGRGEVVGWHHEVSTKLLKNPTDGKQYSYLLVDYELTQPYAQEKHDNGTWRNRSAEIGGYRTNDESEFWPVYLGFAFVDFPAVEGLNFSSSQQSTGARFFAFFSGNNQGAAVGDNTNGGAQGGTALPFPPNMMPGAQSNNGAPANQANQPFVFTVAGQQTSDYAAVQTRLTQLETFAQETREAGRKGFVAGLVSGNKITAPQQPEFEAFALGLGDDQYLQWTKMWEGAGTPAILGNHSVAAVSNPNNSAQPVDQAIRDAEQIVKMHQQGGVMSVDQIKQTKAYETLKSANRIPAGLA
jgi:hypothetical protein